MHHFLPLRLCASTLLVLSFLATVRGIDAATYYISPIGADSNTGTSPTDPWQTFRYAIPQLAPGDTLMLGDGTYNRTNSGFPSINCRTDARKGTAAQPITITAQNERQAFLQSDGSMDAFVIENCSYWIIAGLRFESMDNPSGCGDTFYIYQSDHIVGRRLLAAHNNRFSNSHIFLVYRSSNVLIEESEAYYFHRHGFSAVGSSFVTFRRVYANSRGYPDLHTGDPMYPSGMPAPMDGWPSHYSDRGDEAIVQYFSSDGMVENTISENNECNCGYGEDPGHWYGNISLGQLWGFIAAAYPDSPSRDNAFINNVAVRSWNTGFLAISNINIVVEHLTAIDGTGADGFFMYNRARMTPSLTLRHSLFANNRAAGIEIHDASDFASRTFEFLNAFGNVGPDFGPGTETRTNSRTIDPVLGSCKVWIPPGSPMKGAGLGGADIGANVIYKYHNGILQTGVPLWDASSGYRFTGCGAVIAGVNDTPGNSCIGVHQRLNVGAANGCALPY